jgi:hypothetical protein
MTIDPEIPMMGKIGRRDDDERARSETSVHKRALNRI